MKQFSQELTAEFIGGAFNRWGGKADFQFISAWPDNLVAAGAWLDMDGKSDASLCFGYTESIGFGVTHR